ncbi:hypothetical protein [Micromonospora rhizosphaerae]|nr:hypothetical protein [Micromonospora rhizosphaerae]
MVWRVLGGGVALLGVIGVVLTVAALLHGESAAAPIGVVGLLLLALGLRLAMVPPRPLAYSPPRRVWSSPIFNNYGSGPDSGDDRSSGDGGGSWGGDNGGGGGWWGGDGGGGGGSSGGGGGDGGGGGGS